MITFALFQKGRKGDVLAFVRGRDERKARASFPVGGWNPSPGECWKVKITGENPRGTVWFLEAVSDGPLYHRIGRAGYPQQDAVRALGDPITELPIRWSKWEGGYWETLFVWDISPDKASPLVGREHLFIQVWTCVSNHFRNSSGWYEGFNTNAHRDVGNEEIKAIAEAVFGEQPDMSWVATYSEKSKYIRDGFWSIVYRHCPICGNLNKTKEC